MDAWMTLQHNRRVSLEKHYREEVVNICSAILRAEPDLTRGQAMREAERIVHRRRLQDGSLQTL